VLAELVCRDTLAAEKARNALPSTARQMLRLREMAKCAPETRVRKTMRPERLDIQLSLLCKLEHDVRKRANTPAVDFEFEVFEDESCELIWLPQSTDVAENGAHRGQPELSAYRLKEGEQMSLSLTVAPLDDSHDGPSLHYLLEEVFLPNERQESGVADIQEWCGAAICHSGLGDAAEGAQD
jgi:hypothetical protein